MWRRERYWAKIEVFIYIEFRVHFFFTLKAVVTNTSYLGYSFLEVGIVSQQHLNKISKGEAHFNGRGAFQWERSISMGETHFNVIQSYHELYISGQVKLVEAQCLSFIRGYYHEGRCERLVFNGCPVHQLLDFATSSLLSLSPKL
jgi:hypothetical protein